MTIHTFVLEMGLHDNGMHGITFAQVGEIPPIKNKIFVEMPKDEIVKYTLYDTVTFKLINQGAEP